MEHCFSSPKILKNRVVPKSSSVMLMALPPCEGVRAGASIGRSRAVDHLIPPRVTITMPSRAAGHGSLALLDRPPTPVRTLRGAVWPPVPAGPGAPDRAGASYLC